MLWGISKTVSARAFKPLPLCSAKVGSSSKVTVVVCKSSGALVWMKESHFLSKNSVLRKCWLVSQKQWMIELSNLCHCVQHPWKLTSRDFWIFSRHESGMHSHLCKNVFWENAKMCFEKMLRGISEMVSATAFKPLPLCSAKVGSSAKFV